METLELSEHETRIVALDPQQQRELRGLPPSLLRVSPLGEGRFGIRTRSHVGTVALPSLQLLIRPKIAIRNVLYLLAYAQGIDFDEGEFPYEVDDLAEAVAWWFDREAERAARFGLPHDYLDRSEALTTIRGRIALERQIALRPGQLVPIECDFQDYSEDTALNRVVKAAHERLLQMPGLERALAKRLRHRARVVFGDVRSVAHHAAVPELSLAWRHREWRAAYVLARMILAGTGIRDALGSVHAAPFTVDMNVVFQQFMAAVVRERLGATGGTLAAGRRLWLTEPGTRADGVEVPQVPILPDLVVQRDGRPVALADLKYKGLPGGAGWESRDAYQLLAYCVRLGLRRGLLIYCGRRPLGVSRVVGAPLALATVGVDLTGSRGELLAQARAAADALIAQAGDADRAAA